MWLSKAAEQGHHGAQARLAELYEKGRGVPHDLKRAYIWQLLALEGSRSSQEIKDLARYMTDGDIADAEHDASAWLSLHNESQKPKAPPELAE
jgi:TPR repeat protein